MENKTKYITPFIMLFAGALAAIIMLLKQYEFYRMLWTLLIVLIVFYVIGDVVRYLYASIRPKIIPVEELENLAAFMSEGQMTEEEAEESEEALDESEDMEEGTEEDYAADSEEVYGTDDYNDDAGEEEYTEETLDEM